MFRTVHVALAVALCLCASATNVYAAGPAVETFMVEMPDGVKLATDVYLPANDDGTEPRYPAILLRTPYGKQQGKGIASQLCPHGYIFVAQDMRGRFTSEGRSMPVFGNEGLGERKDGHDTIEWIVKQSWSNGRVATWGGSASAIVQNMAAPDAPESLKGQFVLEAFSDYYHQFVYPGGVWQSGIFESWASSQQLVDGNVSLFREHPYYDEFWKRLSPELHASRVNAPAIYIGGWYDFFSQGTINSFVTVQNTGGPLARGKCLLVMGPIAHGLFHDRLYPGAAKAPIHPFLPMEFYNYWLKGESAEAVESLKPVHYYVMGALGEAGAPGNYWRSQDAWPPQADLTPFHLHPSGMLRREQIPTSNDALTYQFDPADPVVTPGSGGTFPDLGPLDLRPIESRPDVLVFSTEPLDEPLEVTGRISAKLYVSSNCRDTDFAVTLTDVYPDGRSMRVAEGIRRASLREGFDKPQFLAAGEVYEVDVDLWSTSLVFNKGHRIRVVVSSSNTPRFEPNPNTGATHYVAGKSRVATNTVHLSTSHPSQVLLPIYSGPAKPAATR